MAQSWHIVSTQRTLAVQVYHHHSAGWLHFIQFMCWCWPRNVYMELPCSPSVLWLIKRSVGIPSTLTFLLLRPLVCTLQVRLLRGLDAEGWRGQDKNLLGSGEKGAHPQQTHQCPKGWSYAFALEPFLLQDSSHYVSR